MIIKDALVVTPALRRAAGPPGCEAGLDRHRGRPDPGRGGVCSRAAEVRPRRLRKSIAAEPAPSPTSRCRGSSTAIATRGKSPSRHIGRAVGNIRRAGRKTQQEAVALFRWFLLEAAKAGVTFLCDWPEHPQLWNPAPLDEELRAFGLTGMPARCCCPTIAANPGRMSRRLADNLRQTAPRPRPSGTGLGVWIPEEDRQEFNPALLASLGRLQAVLCDEPIIFQMHLAESKKRKEACRRPLARLLDHGLIHASAAARTAFRPRHLDRRGRIADPRSSGGDHLGVITCPKFADGRVAPIKELLEGGVAVGLGLGRGGPRFPGSACGTCWRSTQAGRSRCGLNVGEALYMATLGGARAFGMERRIGSIEEGKDADIVLGETCPAALDPELFAPGDDGDRQQEKLTDYRAAFHPQCTAQGARRQGDRPRTSSWSTAASSFPAIMKRRLPRREAEPPGRSCSGWPTGDDRRPHALVRPAPSAGNESKGRDGRSAGGTRRGRIGLTDSLRAAEIDHPCHEPDR